MNPSFVPTMFQPDVLGEFMSPIYDTYTADQNATLPNEITFFGNLVGTVGLERTNIQEAFKIPAPGQLDVLGMGFEFVDTFYDDIIKLAKNYVAELWISNMPYLQAPISFFPSGRGVNGFAALSTTASTTTLRAEAYTLGEPHVSNMYTLGMEHALQIKSGVNFEVKLKTRAATPIQLNATAALGKGLFLRCYLDGIRRRGVQG